MPTIEDDRKIFSLSEVLFSIQRVLLQRYTSAFWVKAEMSKLNYYVYSGHAYPDLVEKKNNRVVAQIRSVLWKTDFEVINARFLEILKEPLKDGITILFLARITFDPVYGLSLRILDIDPTYTLGTLEQEKQQTLQRLAKENLLYANKQLLLPFPFPQRLAIISVETSKGYSDFCKVLDQNPYGYTFFRMLFPSILQGERAIEGITAQLRNIKKLCHHFDMVVIVRGGGGDIGLSCYNSFELSAAIASFPLPVLTGIGHSTNETVAEMVAFKSAITPTELADFIIDYARQFDSQLQLLNQRLHNITFAFCESELQLLRNITQQLTNTAGKQLGFARHELDFIQKSLSKQSEFFFKNKFAELQHLQNLINWNSPSRILKQGYSISKLDGVLLQKAKNISHGQTMTTLSDQYHIESIVQKITPVKK